MASVYLKKRSRVCWILSLLLVGLGCASCHRAYRSLDTSCPIVFHGDYFVYQGDTVVLSEKAFYVDATVPEDTAAKYPFVFTSFNAAAQQLTNGTESEPMQVYIAPYVYWIDDPDDPAERVSASGGTPFGLEVSCEWLSLIGLNEDPQNVVLACNRGQTQGADGNFTMFRFTGNGFYASYITFGNYCNIDLVYPLKKSLNRAKRFEAITQAQLAICSGDRIMAEHCRFVSRLNLCPLMGGQRLFFNDCHFESTDDALSGNAVYLNCDLDFYSSKPFYSSGNQGSVFLNCVFNLKTTGVQYLTKAGSQVTIVDGRFIHPTGDIFLGWTQYPDDALRCYASNVTLNDEPVMMQSDKPWVTVDITKKPLLGAYKIVTAHDTLYNTYNLLCGSDDWDPMGVKERVLQASAETGLDYANIPTLLSVSPSSGRIETGQMPVVFTAYLQTMNRTSNRSLVGYGMEQQILSSTSRSIPVTESLGLQWFLAASPDRESVNADSLANMKLLSENMILLAGKNENEEATQVFAKISHRSGLESASVVTVSPSMLESPSFMGEPVMTEPESGKVSVQYELDLQGRRDESLIAWYRCADSEGNHAIPIVVSRLDQPEKVYTLKPEDVGYYLMASIQPKHLRSEAGDSHLVISQQPVASNQVAQELAVVVDSLPFVQKVLAEAVTAQPCKAYFFTDFQRFPSANQKEIIPGFWTLDVFKPADITKYDWKAGFTDGWMYGAAEGGAVGKGFLQATKGARMMYTPLEGKYGDMYVRLLVDPCKTAGQGFGSATAQYMDVYIKFDPSTLTGYALRIERTTKYSNAVDFVLIQYENGATKAISEPVSASCFRTQCSIVLGVSGTQLNVHVETATDVPAHSSAEVVPVVDLSATIAPSNLGGTGIQHTGSIGASATMLHEMEIVWW